MGDRYAVAPLPYTDDSRTTRLGSYLGYKFYGVNASIDNDAKKSVCHDVAQFLVSAYAQKKRFDTLKCQGTITSIQSYFADEPHVQALQAQKDSNSTILLCAAGTELWSACQTALTKVNLIDAVPVPADKVYWDLLADLDVDCQPK